MAIDKEKIIKREVKKLNKLAKEVDPDKQAAAAALVQELGFMAGTLAELKDHVNTNGAVEWFKNGSQEMWRESPALKSYSTLVQRYSLLYKQLVDLMPKDSKPGNSELLDFIAQSF